MERLKTKDVKIGNLELGGNNKVLIQSMTNTKTHDIVATVNQILRLEKLGCDIIRVAVKNISDASAIKEIKKQIHIPLVADIHFDYKLALLSIENGVDKIRLNPGNIKDKDKIKLVVDACKEKNISIRIGVNAGSLPSDLDKTPEGLIEAAKRQISILEENDFHNIVLSFKASDIDLFVETNRLASQIFNYPLHIGLTESGTDFGGLIKSTIAISTLLKEGIGNTIRVSLTGDPETEIKAAKEILSDLHLLDKPTLTSCPTCGRTEYDMIPIAKEIEEYLYTVNKKIHIAIMGCVVNGPGEAKDADIAICGGKEEALLYKKGQIVKKIKQNEIVDVLKEEIDNF